MPPHLDVSLGSDFSFSERVTSTDSKLVQIYDIKQKTTDSNGNQYICMVCRKNFATKSDLMLHKRLYIRKKKICALCNFCNKTLEQKNLKIHEQFHHKNELKQSDVNK